MQEFRSAKGEFHDKDVVFVYLTNASSPRTLWEEKIKGIGSEHYYLNDSQWKYVMDHFGFEYIPSYLLYNKKGLLWIRLYINLHVNILYIMGLSCKEKLIIFT
jgi:hypothetical protein